MPAILTNLPAYPTATTPPATVAAIPPPGRIALVPPGTIEQLAGHPLLSSLDSPARLQFFMEHHVYAVWDFMSLLKGLQELVAPDGFPWHPPADARVARIVNELVLEEESDRSINPRRPGYGSHFEGYLQAMREAGALTIHIEAFLMSVRDMGIRTALAWAKIPLSACRFVRGTFTLLNSGRAHELAAAVAVSREAYLGRAFSTLVNSPAVSRPQAGLLKNYLDRHIFHDGGAHKDMMLEAVEQLCGDSDEKWAEAGRAASEALERRRAFWDSIHRNLPAAGGSA